MGILNGEIVISTLNRIDAVKHVLESSVTEESLIVTLFAGKGVPTSEVDELVEYATSLNEEIEVQVVDGKQDIYSYIVAVE
jgi:dihydroxyacetone kinase-like predicted kinase